MKAAVQYGDWRGTSAADNSDHQRARDFLRERGLLEGGERLVAFDVWVGKNHGEHKDPIVVTFILDGDYEDVADDELPVLREVRVRMPIGEFLALFKRLNVVLTHRNREVPHEYKSIG